jgi:anti-anti-sigma regulatory factor
MPQLSFPTGFIRGVPVISAPARLDGGNAHLLRAAVARWSAYGYATLVVDLTATKTCDPAAVMMLLREHRRALAEGGELRVVLPAMLRFLPLGGHDEPMPQFSSVAEAVAELPAAAIDPARIPTA